MDVVDGPVVGRSFILGVDWPGSSRSFVLGVGWPDLSRSCRRVEWPGFSWSLCRLSLGWPVESWSLLLLD